MIGTTVSHYEILEKLGEGGMGVVYKARDLRLHRFVALKFLPRKSTVTQEELGRFQQEARAISALNHPHIATIYDVDEASGDQFLVLEYLPGGTLKSHFKDLQSSGRELSIAQVLDYGMQIAEGLAHAHHNGIVHRDMKTENLILTAEGSIKITDFGLAKLWGSTHLTKIGSTIGTAAYMSPEQVRGEELDHRSDLFALGIILYELVTGRTPFRGEHEAALTYSIVNETPASITAVRPGVPEGLATIIDRCLEKEKEKRYQTAEEVLSDLREMRSGPSAPVRTPGTSRSLPWIIGAGIVVGILLAVAFFFLPGRTADESRKSIAVLPFKNLSTDKENEYFSDGITEDIIAQLSNIRELKVISRTSVMRYKETEKSIRDIGSELGVATILEGSVRKAGNQVRIVAQLIDAGTDEHLWSNTYDKEMTQIFAIQSDVAHSIAKALEATLSNAEKERIETTPTSSLDAYAYYLKGREYYSRYHKEDNENAIELFHKALEIDPRYALAYAGLGDAYGQRVQKFGFSRRWIDSSLTASRKAISLNPNLAEAYKSLGLAYGEKGLYRQALDAVRKAVDLNPNYYPAVANIGWGFWLTGRFDEALIWMKKGLDLNPAFAYSYLSIGVVYLRLGEFDRARSWFDKALELQPDLAYAYVGNALAFQAEGRIDQALEEGVKLQSRVPDDPISMSVIADISLFAGDTRSAGRLLDKTVAMNPDGINVFTGSVYATRLAYVAGKTGDQAKAQTLLQKAHRLDRQLLEEGNESASRRYDLACIASLRGDRHEALTWLQRAVDAGWRDYLWGMNDPLLESLHSDQAFRDMMDNVQKMVAGMRDKVRAMESQ